MRPEIRIGLLLTAAACLLAVAVDWVVEELTSEAPQASAATLEADVDALQADVDTLQADAETFQADAEIFQADADALQADAEVPPQG
jgi:hypothetical protein